MRKSIMFNVLAAFILCAPGAFAKEGEKGALRKQFIEGRKSGALTKEEAKAIRAERKKIKELRQAARSDGKVSEDEKKGLQEARKNLEAKLNESLNNSERRAPKKNGPEQK